MTQKISYKTVQLDNTKMTSLLHYRSGEMSDATRLLRKQQFFKRKLKSALDINGNLEKQIKNHEVQIKDERSGITFQLNDLIKELSGKFDFFIDEKLEKTRFKTNQISQLTFQQMMQKYQKIQQQCELLKKIYESLDSIDVRYESHSKSMEELVISLEISNKEYEQFMENSLNDINEQIKGKISENQKIDIHTQQIIKEIDGFVDGVKAFKQEESKMVGKIEKLKKMAMKQQEKVNEIKEWAEIIIDKDNRQMVYKTLNEKEKDLMKLKGKNDQLEMYLNELQSEEKLLIKASKENTYRPKSERKSSKTKRKEYKMVHLIGK